MINQDQFKALIIVFVGPVYSHAATFVRKDFIEKNGRVHRQAYFLDCKNEHPIIFPRAQKAQVFASFDIAEDLQPQRIYHQWKIYGLTSRDV